MISSPAILQKSLVFLVMSINSWMSAVAAIAASGNFIL